MSHDLDAAQKLKTVQELLVVIALLIAAVVCRSFWLKELPANATANSISKSPEPSSVQPE